MMIYLTVFMEKQLKKSLLNKLLDGQIKTLEILDGCLEIYIDSKEFRDLSEEEKEAVYKLKVSQKEYINSINKYIKY